MRIIILYLFVFFSLFGVNFAGLPVWTKTNFIVGIIGLVYWILLKEKKSQTITLLFISGLLILLTCLASGIINFRFDSWIFQHYILCCFIYVFNSFIITKWAIKAGVDFYGILKITIGCIFINNILALSAFYLPSLADAILSVQDFSVASFGYDYGVRRIYGFGDGGTNFGGGVTCSIGLIFAVFLFVNNKLGLIKTIIVVLFLTFSGILIARTSVLGAAFAIGSITLYKCEKSKKTYFIISIMLICIVSFIILFSLFGELDAFQYSFDMFTNYESGGGLSNGSTDKLFNEHWAKLPHDIKTWLFGDSRMLDIHGSGYYMHTDVGYLRMIFCFGITGLAFFIVNHIIIIKYSHKILNDSNTYRLVILLFIYILILNIKGLVDSLFWIMALPLFYYEMFQKKLR